jgi:hypothetical protein
MLLAKEFVAQVLPGWVFNVAMIFHAEEAVLAAGFLFTVHFFNNHWRPENFPLDIMMFTGTMPLEKFKREHPLEYKRLVASGELQQYLTEAPSRPLTLGSKILGFTDGSRLILLSLILVGSRVIFSEARSRRRTRIPRSPAHVLPLNVILANGDGWREGRCFRRIRRGSTGRPGRRGPCRAGAQADSPPCAMGRVIPSASRPRQRLAWAEALPKAARNISPGAPRRPTAAAGDSAAGEVQHPRPRHRQLPSIGWQRGDLRSTQFRKDNRWPRAWPGAPSWARRLSIRRPNRRTAS